MRRCRKCGTEYPLTKEHFGHQPNGSYRYTCRACVRKNVARHHRENPWRSRERTEMRSSSNLTASDKAHYELLIKKRDGRGCYYCKKMFNYYHIDHKVPVTRGGVHGLANFVLACSQCNQEKHNKTVDEYRIWLRTRGEKVNF